MKRILHHGKVYVEKDVFSEAVFIEDGIIKAVGSNDDILGMADGETELTDCGGKTLIPGLNDSHMHFMQLGETRNQADIDGVPSIDEMISRCRAFIEEHPEHVRNGLHAIGWNQDLFTDEQRMPDRHDLDKISTEFPVVLERVCGHIVSSNTKAIEMLGIDGDSPQFPDGDFLIGEDGYPNGIFTANACNYVKTLIPDFTMEERRKMLVETMEYAVSCGITSVQSNDVGTTFMDGPAAFAMFRDVYDSGEALLRYRHQVCFNDLQQFEQYLTEGEFAKGEYGADSWLTLGPLKLFKDGSLGARTALMRQGYVNDPENHGLEWIKEADMEAYCQLAKKYGLQVVTHCIGDMAVEKTMDCYERAFVEGENKLRHGLIHCQITDEGLVRRIAEKDILVFAQPIFLDYDMQTVSYTHLDVYKRQGLGYTKEKEVRSVKKPVPIGYEDIKEIIDKDYYYVDKTAMLADFLSAHSKVTLFTRPRRFGKTLNQSMFRRFFEDERNADGGKIDNGYIFDSLGISNCGERFIRHQQQYPVISLSLKSGKQQTYENALGQLKKRISEEFTRHGYVLQSDRLNAEEKDLYRRLMNWESEDHLLSLIHI